MSIGQLGILENRTCYLTMNVLLDIRVNKSASKAFSKAGNTKNPSKPVKFKNIIIFLVHRVAKIPYMLVLAIERLN